MFYIEGYCNEINQSPIEGLFRGGKIFEISFILVEKKMDYNQHFGHAKISKNSKSHNSMFMTSGVLETTPYD